MWTEPQASDQIQWNPSSPWCEINSVMKEKFDFKKDSDERAFKGA